MIRLGILSWLQNIESRLKVSLPSDLGAALTDGVVLCHLANHVRPRSVPSIHVPSPAVVSYSVYVWFFGFWVFFPPLMFCLSFSQQRYISFQPKLTMAKCRRNVENFLEACRKIGVPQVSLKKMGSVGIRWQQSTEVPQVKGKCARLSTVWFTRLLIKLANLAIFIFIVKGRDATCSFLNFLKFS